jgi:hypothetical protein
MRNHPHRTCTSNASTSKELRTNRRAQKNAGKRAVSNLGAGGRWPAEASVDRRGRLCEPPGEAGETRPVVALLGDPQRWERRLLAASINEDWARSLSPVTWDAVLEKVYIPMWRAAVKENARVLQGVTLTRLPFAGRLAAGGLLDEDNPQQTVLYQVTSSPWLCSWRCWMPAGR